MTETVIRVAWITEAMKARAYYYYHRVCYTGSTLPNQEVSELALEDVGCKTVCCGRWKKIKEK